MNTFNNTLNTFNTFVVTLKDSQEFSEAPKGFQLSLQALYELSSNLFSRELEISEAISQTLEALEEDEQTITLSLGTQGILEDLKEEFYNHYVFYSSLK